MNRIIPRSSWKCDGYRYFIEDQVHNTSDRNVSDETKKKIKALFKASCLEQHKEFKRDNVIICLVEFESRFYNLHVSNRGVNRIFPIASRRDHISNAKLERAQAV